MKRLLVTAASLAVMLILLWVMGCPLGGERATLWNNIAFIILATVIINFVALFINKNQGG
jgi:hypothetical protein